MALVSLRRNFVTVNRDCMRRNRGSGRLSPETSPG
jgi:hypothetical protein